MLIRKAMLIRYHADPGAREPAVLPANAARLRARGFESAAPCSTVLSTDDGGFAVAKGRRLTLDRIRECADG
jgi:hypothetical protein